MKLLHTSDWHVGKKLRGQPRLHEHHAVLAEIAAIAEREAVDLVLVAGDLFESAAPPPEAQAVVWDALMALRATGAEVVVIAGNHDNPRALEATRPLTAAAGITVAGQVRPAHEGGVVEVRARSTGEVCRVAALPFLSQRHVVRAAELMAPEATAATHAGAYAERMGQLVAALTSGPGGFEGGPPTVNVVVAHCFVRGGRTGGGEREAQSIEDYWVDATVFPPTAHYVALGHLHRTQQLGAAPPVWYSGSPIQVDFGEEHDTKHVLIVEASPSAPARVTPVPLTSPARLRSVSGTLAQLAERAATGELGDAWLRVTVEEPARVGLADEVRRLLPRAVDIRVARERDHPDRAPGSGDHGADAPRRGRTAPDLFAAYLRQQDVADPAVERLFRELLDEVTTERAEAG